MVSVIPNPSKSIFYGKTASKSKLTRLEPESQNFTHLAQSILLGRPS